MQTDIEFSKIIVNLTTQAAVSTDEYATHKDDGKDLRIILTYAIPLSCLTILVILFLVIGIRQRHRVLDKWTSLRRMRNTNPRFLQSVILRRDSEFDSYNRDDVLATVKAEEHSSPKEIQYQLTTLT